ncbi:MAG: FHA domain-containing protein, partial [Phycisphaerales bacterium]|nr:FHA domain-containing protein [Phycisphaerales bacterium]
DSETVIGRGDGCSLQLVDEKASRKHCCIKKTQGATLGGTGIASTQHVLVDMGSSNGTTIDGETMRDELQLTDGMSIGIGNSKAIFLIDTYDSSKEALAYCSSIGKGEDSDEDAWPLDPPWKSQTLSEDPRDSM